MPLEKVISNTRHNGVYTRHNTRTRHNGVFPGMKTQFEAAKTLIPLRNSLCKFLSGYTMNLFLTCQELI